MHLSEKNMRAPARALKPLPTNPWIKIQKRSKLHWKSNSSKFYIAQLWARGRVSATFFVIREILFSFLSYSKHKIWCVVMHAKPFITFSDNKNEEIEKIRSCKKSSRILPKFKFLFVDFSRFCCLIRVWKFLHVKQRIIFCSVGHNR